MKAELKIEYVNPDLPIPYAGNAKIHTGKQIRQIAKSIKRFGFIAPILMDDQGQLIAGHGRLQAAKELALTRIPAIRVSHLTDAERRALMLADNKLSETGGGWDSDLLRVELEFLMAADVDFEVDITGFSTPEIDFLLHADTGLADANPIPDVPPLNEVVSRLDDIWQVGSHRVACGDCRDQKVTAALLDGAKARSVVTDSPFNVPIKGYVSGLGKHQHDEFQFASGEMSSAQFTEFLSQSIASLSAGCVDGALLYFAMDWKHLPELFAACASEKLTPVNLCVWVKSNGGMGSLYRSQHELFLVVKKGKASHVNNVELGRHGRYRTNVWHCPGQNAFGAGRDEALAAHPTVKPVSLIADAILDSTNPGDIVLDFFLGSGTTLIAAEHCKRRCYGIEIEPKYVDVALKRWITLGREEPIHIATGLTYSELRQQRLSTQEKPHVQS